MALKRPKGHPGTLVVLEHDSKILRGNPLGDPHVRKLGVWLPPGYDHAGKKRYPVLYDLVGFTGSGLAHANWKPFGDNVPERAARLMLSNKYEPLALLSAAGAKEEEIKASKPAGAEAGRDSANRHTA